MVNRSSGRQCAPNSAATRGNCAGFRAFLRNGEGNLTMFALILFVSMVMIGGLAVDVMRFEAVRTHLQNTLDRSTLAAASLTQQLDAEEVVYDYFEKAGLAEYLTSVDVDEGLNYREVTADATAATNPFFLHMMGIEDLDAGAIPRPNSASPMSRSCWCWTCPARWRRTAA